MPALSSSPATLTWTRTSVSGVPWRPSCSSAESDATEWISCAYGRICLTLRLWSWPMKCQRNAGPVLRLGLQLLGAVLADQVDAGVGERAELGGLEVLDGGQQLDAGRVAADALARGGDRARGRARRRRSGRPRDPSLAPGGVALAAVARRSARRRSCTGPVSWTALDARGAQLGGGDDVEREVALADAARRRPRSARGPPPPPRSSSRARSARARRRPARRAQRLDPGGDDPARQPAPAAVQHRDAAGAPTSAIGRQSAVRTSAPQRRVGGDEAVGLAARVAQHRRRRGTWCARRHGPEARPARAPQVDASGR